jgi:hypothetical protein
LLGCSTNVIPTWPENNSWHQTGKPTSEAFPTPTSDTYLTFKDFKSFKDAAITANKMHPDLLNAEQEKLGFVSIQRRFNTEIKDFEVKELPAILAAPSTGSEPFVEQMSKRVRQKLQENYFGLITYDPEYAFQLQVYPRSYAPLLNRYGVVKVGQDLYQFAQGYMKVIHGGDPNLIPLLFSTFQTDKPQGIEVTRIRVSSQANAQEANRTFVGQAANCRNTVGSFRVLVYEDVYRIPQPGGGYELEVVLQSRSRANLVWQNWSTADLRANGNASFFNQPTINWNVPADNTIIRSERVLPNVAGITTSTQFCSDASTCLRSRTDGFGPGGTWCYTRNF